jgi:hypothetical protein
MERREESAKLEPVFWFLELDGDVVWVELFCVNLGARLWPSALLCCELAT